MITNISSHYRIISDHSFAVVRQNIVNNQKAFFAQRTYQPGDVVLAFSAKQLLSEPSYLTVQVGIDKHIMLHPEHLQYINHSCDPNVFFDTHAMQIVALKSIAEGDEMTFFYPSTEWKMKQSFRCYCGSNDCIGEIKGAFFLSKEAQEKYRFTDFIQQQLAKRSVRKKVA